MNVGLSGTSVVITVVFATLLGGALGSFAGVVASRGWRASLRGRSHCDSCGRTLSWYELVPLLSYVGLRARCRTCGASIGWAPFLWEAGGAAIALAIAVPLLVVLGG
jgi:leader peptidase (prepilin peptidase) / N-methyltransferase